MSGYLSTSDWNTFNNKQTASAELNGIASLALTGIVQRTAAGTYTALAVNAPLAASGSSLSISNIPAGLITTGTLSTTVLPSTVVLAGGNSLGADLSVGTNDTQGVSLRTGGTNRLSIDSAGTAPKEFPPARTTVLGRTVVDKVPVVIKPAGIFEILREDPEAASGALTANAV
jgi:hypothetical protein